MNQTKNNYKTETLLMVQIITIVEVKITLLMEVELVLDGDLVRVPLKMTLYNFSNTMIICRFNSKVCLLVF